MAAEQFATDPTPGSAGCRTSWRGRSRKGSTRSARSSSAARYLNPSQFGRFRPYFTRSAFEVVDCPPLTSSSRASAKSTW